MNTVVILLRILIAVCIVSETEEVVKVTARTDRSIDGKYLSPVIRWKIP